MIPYRPVSAGGPRGCRRRLRQHPETDGKIVHVAVVDFETVRAQWLAAGGKNTSGIIEWFAPPFVERWDQAEIRAREVADLRFIGAEAGGRWAGATGGSNRVGDLQLAPGVGFRWDAGWLLVCVRNPESGERVLIDGNERACQLQAAVVAGAIAADQPVKLATGDLYVRVVLVSKAISSLWR